ncbi:MAG: YkgJ family cysteine cluster protein [Alphaproteobacteria bacterium]|nr:YkgJ family cysteine cluster protein [Alphaproteobacteria bacterium]
MSSDKEEDRIGSEEDGFDLDEEGSSCGPQPRGEEFNLFEALRDSTGNADPVTPVRLLPEDTFQFRCHKDVSCWNRCCHGADITLTPSDILRLSKHFNLTASEFLAQHTVPAFFPRTNLPVAKLKMGGDDGKGACHFMNADGCSVYASRPQTCRYYPLGLVSMKMKDSPDKQDFHFLVREEHCKGHDEKQTQNVAQYREQQGVLSSEAMDRGWIDILMKMASWSSMGGPMGKAPTAQTQKMFFMATTDVEGFRRFVLNTKFLETYEIDDMAVDDIKNDDEAALQLAFDWLKNILFNEPTIMLKEQVLQQAIAKVRTDLGAG